MKQKYAITGLKYNVTHLILLVVSVFVVAFAGSPFLGGQVSARISSQAGFRYFSQDDSRWANKQYPYRKGHTGEGVMSATGCGPASMAMVATNLITEVSPYTIAQKYGKKYHYNYGTSASVYSKFAKDYGLKRKNITSYNKAKKFLNDEHTLVIAHTGPGIFTGTGHIIVIRDYKNGKFLIADPKHENNNRWFTTAELKKNGNIFKLVGFSR